jgi:hypothetical protein
MCEEECNALGAVARLPDCRTIGGPSSSTEEAHVARSPLSDCVVLGSFVEVGPGLAPQTRRWHVSSPNCLGNNSCETVCTKLLL